jgi:hypothetical protein
VFFGDAPATIHSEPVDDLLHRRTYERSGDRPEVLPRLTRFLVDLNERIPFSHRWLNDRSHPRHARGRAHGPNDWRERAALSRVRHLPVCLECGIDSGNAFDHADTSGLRRRRALGAVSLITLRLGGQHGSEPNLRNGHAHSLERHMMLQEGQGSYPCWPSFCA